MLRPSKAYTADDISELLKDTGFGAYVNEYEALLTEPDLGQFDPPNVNTLVMYGYDLDTPTGKATVHRCNIGPVNIIFGSECDCKHFYVA